MRRSVIILPVLLGLMLSSSTVIATPPRADQFDPRKIALAETKMWKAYYDRSYTQIAVNMVAILVAQFNVSYFQAVSISIPAAKAARKFHRLSYGTSHGAYQRDVIPDLTLYYQRLKQATFRKHWQPETLAQAELAWWIARRQKHPRKIWHVGNKIAKLYEHLYGTRNDNINRAGFLRAQAAHMRDTQSNRLGVDWKSIEDRLALSYHFLKLGI